MIYHLPFYILLMMDTGGCRFRDMIDETLSRSFVDVQIWGMTEDTGGCWIRFTNMGWYDRGEAPCWSRQNSVAAGRVHCWQSLVNKDYNCLMYEFCLQVQVQVGGQSFAVQMSREILTVQISGKNAVLAGFWQGGLQRLFCRMMVGNGADKCRWWEIEQKFSRVGRAQYH